MKRVAALLGLFAGLLGILPEARACRCVPPPPPLSELEKADVVFRGTLWAFNPINSTSQQAYFLVQTIWKGPIRSDYYVNTGIGGADCGFPFVPGQKYIVYAFGSSEVLTTHTCTRTTLENDAEAAALGAPIWEAPEASSFLRGDPDEDGRPTISDALRVLNFLFLGGVPPLCLDSADLNDDGKVDLADAIYHMRYLFVGSAAPPPPFPDCGPEATADELNCERYRACAEG